MTPSSAWVEMVNVDGQRVMELTVQPGWKWSKDIKPMVGRNSFEVKHVGVIVEGAVTCRHDDEMEVSNPAGKAYAVDPRHDAWVEGDAQATANEFHGVWGENG